MGKFAFALLAATAAAKIKVIQSREVTPIAYTEDDVYLSGVWDHLAYSDDKHALQM